MTRRPRARFPRALLALAIPFLAATPAFPAGFSVFAQGAKASGMGLAFPSVADDPSAIFSNPAGLGWQKRFSVQGLSAARAASRTPTATPGSTRDSRGEGHGRRSRNGPADLELPNPAQTLFEPNVPAISGGGPSRARSRPLRLHDADVEGPHPRRGVSSRRARAVVSEAGRAIPAAAMSGVRSSADDRVPGAGASEGPGERERR